MSPEVIRARFAFPALLLCAFFGTATFTSVSPFLNEISADLDVSAGLTGQLTSVSALAAGIIALTLVPFVERFVPTRLLVGGVGAVGLASLGTGLAPWFPALLALQFVVGAASTIVSVAALIALGRIYPDPAARSIRQGLIIGMLGAGPLVGTPILRLIADTASWRTALAGYGLVAVAVALVAVVILPVLPAERQVSQRSTSHLADALHVARLPGVGRTLATNALNGLTWGVLGAFLAGAFIDRHPGHDGWIGALWFTDGVGWLIGSTLGGVLIARISTPERLLTGAMTAMALAMSLFAWLESGPIITLLSFGVWIMLFGIASNTIFTLYTQHAGDRGPAVLFLDSTLYKLAIFVGGIGGGIAVDLAGTYVAWSGLLVTTSILATLPLVLRLRTQPVPRRPAIAK